MFSKNKPAPSRDEREHIERVKLLPCSVCDEGGGHGAPSDAHEIKQGQWYTAIALCHDCHQGDNNGLHGRRRMWAVKKMDEIDALAVTIQRLMKEQAHA